MIALCWALLIGALASPPPAAVDQRFDDLHAEILREPTPELDAVRRLRGLYPETQRYDPYGHQGDALRRAGDQALARKDWEAAIKSCQALLKRSYVDIDAHLQCAHAYTQMKGAWADHHRAMITGLLKAIIDDRTGRSPQQAWRVLDVSEAHAVLKLLKLTLERQRMQIIDDHRYSVMRVKDPEGKILRVYFNMDIPWRWMRARIGEQAAEAAALRASEGGATTDQPDTQEAQP